MTDRDQTELAAPALPALTGHALIQSFLKTLDASPGVYRMLDAEARVLYVGKARNLKARVSNYARPSGHSGRIARMIRETAQMMFLTTRTETEALLLEQNLIKQLKPRYNVLLRDDKSFPNILLSREHRFAQIKKHRGKRSEKGSYFGPFASAGAVNRTLNQLQRVFLLRTCTDATFESRTRPCLLYQIKRCSAPCVGYVTEADYNALIDDAENFLEGRSTAVQAHLAAEMAKASEAMEFERAAALRDRIKALTQVQSAQGINPRGVAEADVIALHLEGGHACVQVFFIRGNQNWGNRDFYPRTGAGQVSAVARVLADLGVDDVPMVGVAKGIDRDAGKEEFHRSGLPPFALRHNDPVLFFVQRLRDEAHRWAIGAHRAKRAKAVGVTPLDDIPGVGATRKRALLQHFGSAKAVARAGLPDLMAVEGISATMAQTIHDFFHDRG